MILRGILDRSLSNQLCLRGFAPIKGLASISEADDSYQRDLYYEQADIVKKFLENEKYLFFPEVILSYKFKHKGDVDSNPFVELKNIKGVRNSFSFKSNVDNTKFRGKRLNYKSSDSRGEDALLVVEIELDDYYVIEVARQHKRRPFHRIDGNHRLTVAENSTAEIVEKMVIPFCVILGEEYIKSDGEILKSEEWELFEKSVRVYFHNINTKSLPLTPEQNLRVIIDEKTLFSDSELEQIFDRSGLLVRQLLSQLNDISSFKGLNHLLPDNQRTIFLELFKCLNNLEKDNDKLIEQVIQSIQTVNELYKAQTDLQTNSRRGILITLLYYAVINAQKYYSFNNWILQNHLFDASVSHYSLIKIFDKVFEQDYKVFVAMPYFNGSEDVVAEYNDIYNAVIKDIGKKFSIKISLYPIMQNKGATQDQIQDIINKIQECKIFIADISGNNANVMYEAGWARALKRPTLLFREKHSDNPKSDYANDTYHIYDKSFLNRSLSKIAHENIVEILTKNYGIISLSK